MGVRVWVCVWMSEYWDIGLCAVSGCVRCRYVGEYECECGVDRCEGMWVCVSVGDMILCMGVYGCIGMWLCVGVCVDVCGVWGVWVLV